MRCSRGPATTPASAPFRGAIWASLDGLRTDRLQSVFWYHDAQTDDALLTRAVMRSAASLGAELALPATFTGATLTDAGVQVRYESGRAQHEIATRVLVNAAGPWASGVARRILPGIAVPTTELVQARTSRSRAR